MTSDLWQRLAEVEQRVRQAVAGRRATDPAPDDPHRGLYVTPDAVRRLLAAPPAAPATGRPTAGLAGLAERFGLSGVDVDFLLVALAPDVDPRFERFYGYLNDDVTRRRASVGLALHLCGLPPADPARFRFAAGAPLVAGGLVEVRDAERPFLSRALRVPDRVVGHLLGDDSPDPALATVATVATVAMMGGPDTPDGPESAPSRLVRRIGAALDAGLVAVHLHDSEGGARQAAVRALAGTGRGALLVDPAALADAPDPQAVPAVLVREARLRGAGIVLGPLGTSEAGDRGPARPLRRITALAGDVVLLTYGAREWNPEWTWHLPVTIAVAPADPGQRAARWRHALAEATGGPAELPAGAVSAYRLGAEQTRRAASVAARLARLDRRPVGPEHLRAGVRAQNSAGLERLARRITPSVGWADLVLSAPTRRQLRELVVRARHRDRVLGQWRMRPGGGRGRGVVALFAGESGTGKTMSAEVVAADLGMELYVVDLSGVVDKYVGETEKNLERVFTAATGVNGVLLFDEADAIFGKRSQVRDAHDRYANVESAYLLQRIESFDGIAVLTTNLRSNLDEAFTRRLDVMVDFPLPDAEQRLALWDRCLGPALPRAGDVDLRFCAERFELAGGSIRSCAVSAAYLAAEADRPVGMAEVVAAVHQEYRKLGRLLLDSEFGPWLAPLLDPA